ncbi:hypothetical protein RHSIM_Rhsim03G0238900 [Rhododendron simsii]|uniref:Lactoylglutathione lyase n=1 Tax=Rhododendron simsii TaxID=118357 RepID=A0A834H9E0_RHOSS|nr:hypothetical protein RHSIM_Rhsim03G0238900 [Rhododendron simsii]
MEMVRIIPMASSIRPSLSSFRSCVSRFGVSLSTCNSSRRPSFLHLGSAVQQSQLFSVKASKLFRVEGSNMAVRATGNMAQASTSITQEEALEWVKKDNRRMLHVVYRVGDLERTIKFYTECLGMKLLRKRDIPEERYTNAFLGYGPEDSHFVIELTYNYGVDKYDIGTGFGHFGIAVEDVAKTVDLIKAKGGKVTREPGPVKGGSTVIAFIEDPDGYKFELLERGPTPEPLCQLMLRVGDLDRAINFYEKVRVAPRIPRMAFGMELLRKRDNPEYKCLILLPEASVLLSDKVACLSPGLKISLLFHFQYTIAMMGYGPEDKSAVLELTYNYGVTQYDKGNAYAQIAIGTDDVYKTAEVIKMSEGKLTREPGPLPGINTKITACLDPDGWKTSGWSHCLELWFLSIILISSRSWNYFEELYDTSLATVALCRDKLTVCQIKASTLVKSTPPITLSENVLNPVL